MKERDIQRIFGKWIQANPPDETTVYELKMVKGRSLGLDAVRPHQIPALKKAEGRGIYHKISDSPIFKGMKTRFTAPKPFDCLYIREATAYLVIMFYKPRRPKECLFVTPRAWEIVSGLAMESGRKSVTEEQLVAVADKVVEIREPEKPDPNWVPF